MIRAEELKNQQSKTKITASSSLQFSEYDDEYE
jgi:hypothetical protein